MSFVVRAVTTGYIALGFTDGTYGMIGDDAVIGYADSGSQNVSGSICKISFPLGYGPLSLF